MNERALSLDVGVARWDELDPTNAYEILRLRSSVFIVEQNCAYQDLDGLDLAAGTLHLWVSIEGHVVSTLRLLELDGQTRKIGRVATDPAYRGRGFAGLLMRRALELATRPVVLNAQAHLAEWYAVFGFRVSGAGWTEDGIPHLPMRVD
jgi:ElaA protein